jgi:hypothetical protein
MAKKQKLFKRGAWLYSALEKQLTEDEFIQKAGGLQVLEKFKEFPFVSIIFDGSEPILIGHKHGDTISLNMQSNGCVKWQTMEWK